MLDLGSFRWEVLAAASAALAFALAGCTTIGGGRPVIYKHGMANASPAPSERASAVEERASDSTPAVAARPAPPAAPAQAALPAPSVASSSPVAAVEETRNSYTQATRYGDLLFVSGQIAVDPATGAFDRAQTVEAQTRQAMENVLAVLEEHRLTMANVVYVTVYLSSLAHFAAMNPVYHGFFKGAVPARSVVEVGRLPRGALVQIAVIAGR